MCVYRATDRERMCGLGGFRERERESWVRICCRAIPRNVAYLFYGGDGDNKEERQAAGDWAGGGVDDKLQGRRGRNTQEREDGGATERKGER